MIHFHVPDFRPLLAAGVGAATIEAVDLLPVITDLTKLIIQLGIGGLSMWYLIEKIKHLKRQKNEGNN